MTVSYNWLCDYVKTTATIDEVAQILTAIGLEVESVETHDAVRGGLRGVVVGKVLTCMPHPDSDHMHVTTVNVGAATPLQIVCGAPNVAAGQKVPVATIGTKLYFDDNQEITIKKSKLRGVESCGMICAEDELSIGTSHEGIMVLPADAPIGTPIADFLHLQGETVFEIGLTPNRIDAASHIGVARDLAAYLAVHHPEKLQQFAYPSVAKFKTDNQNLPITIKVENEEACPRYTGVTLSGVKVGVSPEWLQKKLQSIGLRPINNVVDITNFVLHEIGHPLHAFDADKIDGNTIVVKTCPDGTVFKTLDNVERKLSAQDLMICSTTQPLCIAGVFGGIGSGVTETTTRVFLESAYFNPVWVRKTAKRHGLSTDASFRYERGADPNITLFALKRAALLIQELAEGTVSSDVIDAYPVPVEKRKITLRYNYLYSIVGKEIPKSMVTKILSALEYEIENENDETLAIQVPTYRVDVLQECDVVEDILRIYDYNNVEIPLQVKSTLSYQPKPDNEKLMNETSDFLSHNGFNEMMNLSFNNSLYYNELHTYPAEKTVLLKNPNSVELNAMRQTLLFGGLESIAHNVNRKQTHLRLYELGNVYSLAKPAGNVTERYAEERHLALFITGLEEEKNWNNTAQTSNFFTLKNVIERLLANYGINFSTLQPNTLPNDIFADGIAYKLLGKPFLELGIVADKWCRAVDVKQEVYFVQLRWNVLLQHVEKQRVVYEELPKYPEVRRDLALLLDKQITFEQLHRTALKTEKKLLKKVSLFDVYEGEKLPEGKKSYALSFVLQDNDKTLKDNDIDSVMNNLARVFEKEFGATLR
ncbi:phenylalanine--tRNA ligase beta subunit [Bacteroidia bacterium]|nr:phenylalanine--tRNA ligase beta subunit [Bacteroidia bacterium]